MEAAPTFEMETNGNNGCSECPAGSGVSRLCTKKNRNTLTVGDLNRDLNRNGNVTSEDIDTILGVDTVCEPCVSGVTFSDSPSRHSACRVCRTCPPNSRVKRECNATHDTECECEPDYYQEFSYQAEQAIVTNQTDGQEGVVGVGVGVDVDLLQPTADSLVSADAMTTPHARHKHGSTSGSGVSSLVQPVVAVMSCKACDLCPHGYGAARACSASHNTICRKCPTSAYSSVSSATQGCSVCTVCRDDQVTINECTPFMDAVCAGNVIRPFDYFFSLSLLR